jgi:hypothetical protein
MASPLLLANLFLLLITALSVQGFLLYPEVRNERCRACRALKDTKNMDHDNNAAAGANMNPKRISADSIYFDMQVAGTPIGRLVFHLTNPSPLPVHTENLIQLAKGSRRSIDPKAHYVGCEFDHSPAFVEEAGMGNNGRYKWGHQLKGRGRNAVGIASGLIVDPENQLSSTHSVSFGGQYYGDKYYNAEDDDDTDNDDPGVVLTVPIVGPGRGSSKFSIVRVGESPKEWRERLLLNLGVVGKMDPSSLHVLHAMARQRSGPPTVVACGVLVLQE